MYRLCTYQSIDEDGEFKGYDIAEGAPKTIRRHFEMLTSGGETVVLLRIIPSLVLCI